MSTKIDAPADDITLPAYRCIKPNCPVSCSDCNHAIPGSDVARLLVVRLLDEFGNDDRDGPYEEGEHPLVDEARAFLCSSPADCVGGWISVAERLPEVGIDVLVYEPSMPDDWPGTLRVSIDHISEDYEGWYSHGEAYEHYLAVAGPDVTCTGLSEKASYTHWMPLPAAPGHAALPAAVDVGAAQAETAQAAATWCQCPACAPVLHASDCAVHNAPALPVGPCDCCAAPGLVPLPATATKEMRVAAVKYANGDAVYKNVAAGALEIEEQIYGEIWEAMAAATPGATHGNN